MDKQITSLQAVFDFGKHRGQTVQEVIDTDTQYLTWLEMETDFSLSENVLEAMADFTDRAMAMRYPRMEARRSPFEPLTYFSQSDYDFVMTFGSEEDFDTAYGCVDATMCFGEVIGGR